MAGTGIDTAAGTGSAAPAAGSAPARGPRSPWARLAARFAGKRKTGMVERRPVLTFFSHLALALGVIVVAFPVYVTFVREGDDDRMQHRERVRQLLEGLAQSGAFAEIDDPVAWQREIRRDKTLAWDQ